MDRPGLLPREVETLEQAEHAALAVVDPEALLDQGAQVAGPPGDAAVTLQVRTLKDQRFERGLPAFVERVGATATGPVPQALDAFHVVAVHPLAARLARHARQLRVHARGAT